MSGSTLSGDDRVPVKADHVIRVLFSEIERLNAIEAAARWLVNIHAGSVAIPPESALGEDLAALRAALGDEK